MKIKNLKALGLACTVLGMALEKRDKFRTYGGQMRSGSEWVITIPENLRCYEIGVVRTPDGSYDLLYDAYNGGLGMSQKAGGAQLQGLLKEYNRQCALTSPDIRQLLGMGATEETQDLESGERVIVLTIDGQAEERVNEWLNGLTEVGV